MSEEEEKKETDKDTDKAKKDKAKKDKGKKDKGKKDKGKKGKDEQAAAGIVSVAAHPRASAQIRSLKGWGGLIGFCAAAFLSWKAGVPMAVLGGRALAAGIAGYIVAWRAIVVAEVQAQMDRHAGRNGGQNSRANAAR
jgi:hypothetical protein